SLSPVGGTGNVTITASATAATAWSAITSGANANALTVTGTLGPTNLYGNPVTASSVVGYASSLASFASGTICDGAHATNDQAAWTAARAALVNGGYLIIPVGTCNFTSIDIPNYMHVIGWGWGVSHIVCSASPCITLSSQFEEVAGLHITGPTAFTAFYGNPGNRAYVHDNF